MQTKINHCQNCNGLILNGRSDKKYCPICRNLIRKYSFVLSFIEHDYEKLSIKERKRLINHKKLVYDIIFPWW